MLMVIFVVLMCIWLFGGCYLAWEPNRPIGLGGTLLPWLCVAILGWVVFGGGAGAVVIR